MSAKKFDFSGTLRVFEKIVDKLGDEGIEKYELSIDLENLAYHIARLKGLYL